MVTVTRSIPMLDKIDKTSKYLKKHGVKVGIFGENAAKEQEGVTIGYYAKCLNFGTSKMEKKSFFYDAVQSRESIEIIKEKQQELLKEGFLGELTGEEILTQLGIFVQQRIKSYILDNEYKNKPGTIARKKRNKENTLRENDFLLNSISFEIVTL